MKKKTNKTIFLTSLLLASILVACKNNEFVFTDNIYDSDDNLKVTEEQIDQMKNELSLEFDKELTDDDLNYLLLYSVFLNNNLNEIDKKKAYNLITLIEDNNYIDKDKAYRDLSLLKIEYKDRGNDVDKYITGRYIFPNNIIEIYDDTKDNSILYHELIHCVFNNENTSDLPSFFIEGTTELLNNEYFSEKPYLEVNSYVYEVTLIKLLCELTNYDRVLLTYSTGDINYITSELEKNSNYDIQYINDLFLKTDSVFKEENMDMDTYVELNNLLNEIYRNKKDTMNFDSTNTKYLLSIFKDVSAKDKYLTYYNDLETLGVSTKIYFNSNKKFIKPSR